MGNKLVISNGQIVELTNPTEAGTGSWTICLDKPHLTPAKETLTPFLECVLNVPAVQVYLQIDAENDLPQQILDDLFGEIQIVWMYIHLMFPEHIVDEKYWELGKSQSLKCFGVNNYPLRAVNPMVSEYTHLLGLYLGCVLDEFPNEILSLTQLQHLDIYGKFNRVPTEICALENLQTLSICTDGHISTKHKEEIISWFPQLKELSIS